MMLSKNKVAELLIREGALKTFFDAYPGFKWESLFFNTKIRNLLADEQPLTMERYPYVSFVKYVHQQNVPSQTYKFVIDMFIRWVQANLLPTFSRLMQRTIHICINI